MKVTVVKPKPSAIDICFEIFSEEYARLNLAGSWDPAIVGLCKKQSAEVDRVATGYLSGTATLEELKAAVRGWSRALVIQLKRRDAKRSAK